MALSDGSAVETIKVERWPTELPLLALIVLASVGIWLVLALSIIGIVYVILIVLFLFFAHLGLIAHVRGSAVRLGAEQFPDLHARVQELSRRAGLRKMPAAYVMQAGGTLNAFATKLFRSRMIVLFSDLLEACGEDAAARDMIIGHEIGHIHAGHLDWLWFIMPGFFVPFLGAAYSRARERTCDRYGAALCGDRRGAVTGLTILAAGSARGPRVNASAFVRQREDLDTGWMTLAKWLAGYPPLCDRVAAIDASLGGTMKLTRGPFRALGILVIALLIPGALGALITSKIAPAFTAAMQQAARNQAQARTAASQDQNPVQSAAHLRLGVNADLNRLAEIARQVKSTGGAFPSDEKALYQAWRDLRPLEPPPIDPCDGKHYGYSSSGDGYVLWSAGLDGKNETEDDIVVSVGTGKD